jgi:hypothetical protein
LGATGGAAASLAAVLGHAETHFGEVEDLSAFGGDHLGLVERSAAAGAGLGGVGDDVVRVLRPLESRAGVSGLAADLAARLPAEASGARGFLPGRVRRGRQGGVMGVARDRRAALDLVLQLAEASQELMVELLLCKQLCVAARECPLGTGEFFGERSDDRLRLTERLRL